MAGVHSKPGADGALWYADIYSDGRTRQFPLTKVDGKTGKKSRPKDEDEARRWAKRLEKEVTRKAAQQATVKRFSRFNTLWPKFYASESGRWRKNTRNDYERAYSKHLSKASFSQKQVRNIDHNDIKAYQDEKVKEGLAPHTINNHQGMLAQFFDYAQREGYWSGPQIPARAIPRLSIAGAKQTVYLSKPEHPALLLESFVPKFEDKYAVLTATLLLTGIRWSEARSLLWSQVSFDPKHPHIHITTTAVGNEIQDFGPKSEASKRWVGLPPTLIAMLKRWMKDPFGDTDRDERFRLGIAPGDGLVFPSDCGTMMSAGNFRKRQFQDAKDRAHAKDASFPLDLPVHGLRHTASMSLQRGGVDPVMLAHSLGHSRRALLGATAVYTHVEAERENPIVAAIMERSIKDSKRLLGKKRAKAAKSGTTPAPSTGVQLSATKTIKSQSPQKTLLAKQAAATAAKSAAKSVSRKKPQKP